MSKFFRMFAVLLIVTVMAQGLLAQTATPIATPVFAQDQVEIEGVLDSISTTTLVVSGFSVNIANARVERGLLPGDWVNVYATITPTGWNAREVERLDDRDDRQTGEFEITGVLTSTGAGVMVIAGQLIDVTSASIEDGVVVGDVVDAYVSRVNGRLVARQIERDSSDDDAETCASDTPDGWRNYRVRAGDTLSSIAARTGISVEELARVNCIDDVRVVIAGTLLFVPRTASNDNDNSDDDNSNDNDDDNSNDNDDDNGNDDNGNDDNGNDNDDDNGNDDNGNDNDDDNGNDDNGNDDDDDNDNDDDDGDDD